MGYDANHNITQISIGKPGIPLERYNYQYDGFNQLTREDIMINGQLSKTMVYAYNNQGNITSIKEYAYQVVFGTPITEKRMFYTYAWKDQLSKIEYRVNGYLSYSQTLSYEASGNVKEIIDSRTSCANIYFEWEGRDLTSRKQNSVESIMAYDNQGVRTYKESGGITTTYTLNGYLVLLEKYGANTIYYTYDQQDTLLSMNYNGTEFFYITNLQGDIIEMVDINGNTVVKYRYDAWGNIIYSWYDTGLGYNLSSINPYRYRGYRYDNDLKLYYLQSRYYDPSIGRFINADSVNYLDPIGYTGLNLYAYCGNNPVMYSDITGEFPILISLAIIFGIGALSGVAGTFIGDIATSAMTGDWSFSSRETYAGSAIGYGVGAIAMAYLGPIAGLAIGSGLSTFAGMSLEKATGTNSRSWEEIALWTGISAGFGALMGYATRGLRISGITSGRGSYQHVMRTQFTNMIRHGYNISLKTATKSFVAMTVSRQLTGGFSTGVRRAAIEWWEYSTYGEKEGIGWA